MRNFIGLYIVLAFLAGCATPLSRATVAANGVAAFAEAAHEVLAEGYEAEQTACVATNTTREAAEDCVHVVRGKYASAWSAYRQLRRMWLVVASAIEGAKLGGKSISDRRSVQMIGGLLAAQNFFSKSIGVLGYDAGLDMDNAFCGVCSGPGCASACGARGELRGGEPRAAGPATGASAGAN